MELETKMKYLSEGSNACLTTVADWKPITSEKFVELLHRYATACSADENYEGGNVGHGGIWPSAYRHDRDTTVTIWYTPKNGKAGTTNISTPVLLTLTGPGKMICFEHMNYAFEIRDGAWVPRSQHDSDCATHNSPAFAPGPCDCRLSRA